MSKDSEKKLHPNMDKLYFAPKSTPTSNSSSSGVQSSRARKRANPSSALALVEPQSRCGRVDSFRNFSAPAVPPLYMPWDRGDLMRRAATFKSMTWFGKPKVVSALNCARRGWVNVEADTLACEFCGARLFFSTPSSWNRQQVEKAALVFSLKLVNGHKTHCQCIDQACDETLGEFPPMPFADLVDKFRERCIALLQLSALPVVSSSAIEYMKSPQLEQFLEQSSMFYGNGSGDVSRSERSDNEGSVDSAKLYYQAQKLISLCGWEPRSLPYVVDSENRLNHSVMKADISSSSHLTTHRQNPNINNADSASNNELMEADDNTSISNTVQSGPNSVVLDCKLCGANVGLWAFSTVERPLEFFHLVGYAEVNSESHSGTHDISSDGASLSKDRSSNLNLTIAGGPPPTKQNFKATISLPFIGRNLRARFSYGSESRECLSVSQEVMQSDSQIQNGGNHHHESGVNVRLENSEVRDLDPRTAPDANLYENGETSEKDSLVMVSSKGNLLHPGTNVDDNEKQESPSVPSSSEANVNSSTTDAQHTSKSNHEDSEDRSQIPVNNELVACGSVKDTQHALPGSAMEFDPIRQHRYFCPWIASTGKGAPGWKRTLSALQLPEGGSPSSASKIKVDDPLTSIRNLFRSPPPKRMKPTLLTFREE